jgi:AraC-like DNA-binding protein
MMHDGSGPTWRQTCFVPAASTPGPDMAVTILGRFQSRGGFVYNQVPPAFSFHFVHGGEGVYEADGRSWTARAGSVFLFVPNVPVHYHDLPGKPWRYSWVHFTGGRIKQLVAEIGGSDRPWCRDDLPLASVAGLLDDMEAAFRSEDHGPLYPQTAAWRLLDALTPRGTSDRTSHLASVVRRIIDEQFALPLKIASLADQLGVDRSTVFRRFQTLYGFAPKTYLDRRRLDQSAALLRDNTLSIADIAARCGYSSAHRFAKAFRTRFGKAPSRQRQ